MRLLIFALAAVASAQLEHSVGEALSWKSLRRAALGDKGAEQLEETLEIGGKHGGGKARGWSEMAYNKLPNAMQSVGLGQDLFRAAKKDPQLASTLKEAAVGYWKKARGIPEPGAFPRRSRRRRRSGTGERRGRVEIQATRTGARAPEPLKRHPQTGERRAPAGLKIAAQKQSPAFGYGAYMYSRSPTHTMCSA